MKPYFQEKNKLENKMCDWVSLIDLSVSLPSHFQKAGWGIYVILHHFLAPKASYFKLHVHCFNCTKYIWSSAELLNFQQLNSN